MERWAVIIVDHGSRLAESNELLEEVARQFGERFAADFPIVEPAHMELAEPSIATAYARCVARGATRIVVSPFFLGPGKHWTTDIPQLTAAAAAEYPETQFRIAAPLGTDALMLDLLNKRLREVLAESLPERAATSPPARSWTVWRQDDAGNRFVVQSGLEREAAEALAAEFESRGHKQLYWAAPSA